jgi:hypothetical protein
MNQPDLGRAASNRVLVAREDVFDRINRMMVEADRNYELAHRRDCRESASYWDGRGDALRDLLDAFYGYCAPDFKIKEADRG